MSDRNKYKAENMKKDENGEQVVKKDDFMDSPLFRMITVFMYLSGVGGMGFAMALYFIFFWDSAMPPIPDVRHK